MKSDIFNFVVALITALGGIELIKYVINIWLGKNSRKLDNFDKLTDFYRDEIDKMRERINKLEDEAKRRDAEIVSMKTQIEELLAENRALNLRRCDDFACQNRKIIECKVEQ